MRKLFLATVAAVVLTAPLMIAAQADDITVKERGDTAVIRDHAGAPDANVVIKDRVGPPDDSVTIRERVEPRHDDKVIIKDR
jgi:hypothetical protein